MRGAAGGRRFGRARELYDAAIAQAHAGGSAIELTVAHSWRALLHLRTGALDDAEADAAMAARTAEEPLARLFAPLAIAVTIDALLERDRAAEAPETMGTAGESLYDALLRCSRGRLLCALRRFDEGVRELIAAGEQLAGLGATSPAAATWRSDAALARLALGDEEGARTLAAEELRLARELGAPRALGIALRAAGLVKRDDRLLAEACSVLEDASAPLEHARALAEHGAALRRAGRRSDARPLLRAALDVATRLGATALRGRAHTELEAAGGRPRRLVLSGREALTASERRVADLAAEGLTNREIAQALFVTPRTVEGHLTQVYRKLDVRGREHLRDALAP